MPKLELGDLDSVAKLKGQHPGAGAKLRARGWAIVTPRPSCTLMFKQELPLLFPDDADVRALVADAMFDPFEYLVARHKDGLLKTDFKAALGRSATTSPAGRVQNVGRKTEEMFKLIGQTASVNTVERCSRPRRHLRREDSLPPGGDEDRQAGVQGHGQDEPDVISSDCARPGHHIGQGNASAAGTPENPGTHPLTLLRRPHSPPMTTP